MPAFDFDKLKKKAKEAMDAAKIGAQIAKQELEAAADAARPTLEKAKDDAVDAAKRARNVVEQTVEDVLNGGIPTPEKPTEEPAKRPTKPGSIEVSSDTAEEKPAAKKPATKKGPRATK